MSTAQLSVVYEGLVLAKAAEARATDAGLFVALAAPMPVGTRLDVERAGAGPVLRTSVRVSRTIEVGGAGEVGVILVGEGGGRVAFDDLFPGSQAPQAITTEVTLKDAGKAHAAVPETAPSVETEKGSDAATSVQARTQAAASSAGIPADLISRLSPTTGVPIVEFTAEPSLTPAIAIASTPAATTAEPESEEEPRADSDGDSRASDAGDKNGAAKKNRNKRRGGGPRR